MHLAGRPRRWCSTGATSGWPTRSTTTWWRWRCRRCTSCAVSACRPVRRAWPCSVPTCGSRRWWPNEITSIDTRSGATGVPGRSGRPGPCGSPPASVRCGSRGTADMLTYFVPPSARHPEPRLEGITVGNGPIGVAAGAGSVWVANAQDGTVSQVDPGSLRVVATDHVGGDPSTVGVAGAGSTSATAPRRRCGPCSPPRRRRCSGSGRRRGPCSRSAGPSGWPAPIRAGCSPSRLGERAARPAAARLPHGTGDWPDEYRRRHDAADTGRSSRSCDAA